MPLVEGFGDEVTVFFSVLLVFAVAALAWMSTNVDISPLVHVIILDRERFADILQRIRHVAALTGTRESNSTPQATVSDAAVPDGSSDAAAGTASLDAVSSSNDNSVSNGSAAVSHNDVASGGDSNVPHLETIGSARTESQFVDDNVAAPNTSSSQTHEHANTECKRAMVDAVSSSSSTESVSFIQTSQAHDADVNTSTPSSSTSESTVGPVPDGHIAVRLRYLNDVQRLVHADPDETIGVFRRTHFATELANVSTVRFVYNGQELRDDAATLRSCRVTDGCVIHCLVTQRRQPQTPAAHVETQHFEIGALMLPLFGVILTMLWYARVAYRGYFNGASTFSLVAITLLYIIALLATFRGSPGEANATGVAQRAHAD